MYQKRDARATLNLVSIGILPQKAIIYLYGMT